jgi:hypothetical protein
MARRHMAWLEATYPTAQAVIDAGSALGAKPSKRTVGKKSKKRPR